MKWRGAQKETEGAQVNHSARTRITTTLAIVIGVLMIVVAWSVMWFWPSNVWSDAVRGWVALTIGAVLVVLPLQSMLPLATPWRLGLISLLVAIAAANVGLGASGVATTWTQFLAAISVSLYSILILQYIRNPSGGV